MPEKYVDGVLDRNTISPRNTTSPKNTTALFRRCADRLRKYPVDWSMAGLKGFLTYSARIIGALGVAGFLGGCVELVSPLVAEVPVMDVPVVDVPVVDVPVVDEKDGDRATVLWQGVLSPDRPLETWGIQSRGRWGMDNLEVLADPSEAFSSMLRVHYPAGSASPSVSRRDDVPLGGTQFYANLGIAPQTSLRLSYYLRFSDNFDFVKGGKLPGLFGGEGASGGAKPDGTDGFSTRFMWRREGDGEVYAYLPTSDAYGTSIGRGNWRFQPGIWYHLEQEVTLNQPTRANGRVRVWLDGNLVLDEGNLEFRTVDQLQIDGLFFSTFFGGNDASWATPQDVYIDFADFTVSRGDEAL